MLLHLKNWFIPHEGNGHRPHFLRGRTARYVVVSLLVLEFGAFILPTFTFSNLTTSGSNLASVLPAVLDDLTNKEREDNHLGNLQISDLLNKAAQMKAEDMATEGYFAHTSPRGLTPWHWLEVVGYTYNYAGENLAINFSDSKDVTEAWMESPTHKANIVKSAYTEMGTGVAVGEYEGKKTTFVAQIYANPVVIPMVPNKQDILEEKVVEVATTSQSNVLGAETETKTTSFVEISRNDQVVKSEILPIQSQQQAPSFLSTLLVSPHNSFNIVLYLFLGFMLAVLLLNIFIKINVQHPDLITNGLAVIAVIMVLFVANNYLSKKNIIIGDSFNYSYSEVSIQ